MDMRNVYVLGVPVKASMFKSRGPSAVATGVRECWRRRASGLAYVGACAVATARDSEHRVPGSLYRRIESAGGHHVPLLPRRSPRRGQAHILGPPRRRMAVLY